MTPLASTSAGAAPLSPLPNAAPDCPMWRLAGFILAAQALAEGMDDDEGDDAFGETIGPALIRFYHRTPAVRSAHGAAAALRVVLGGEDMDEAEARVLGAVVAFLDGLAAAEPCDATMPAADLNLAPAASRQP